MLNIWAELPILIQNKCNIDVFDNRIFSYWFVVKTIMFWKSFKLIVDVDCWESKEYMCKSKMVQIRPNENQPMRSFEFKHGI